MNNKLISKIAIGSAQFGLDYGISNETGKVSINTVKELLSIAKEKNLDIIDTAQAYGNSETVLGESGYASDFNIVTKVAPARVNEIKESINQSLKNLQVNSVYGVLYHNFDSYKNNQSSYNDLLELKKSGLVKKIGFSVYYPSEVEYLINNNIKFDILQLPYSIMDRRFEYLFPEIKKYNSEIHIRSVFLQGLFFMSSTKLNPFFKSIEPKIRKIKQVSDNLNISISSLCINFVLNSNYVDKLILGIAGKNELVENISVLDDNSIVKDNISQLKDIEVKENKYLLPFNWKL